MVRDNSYIVILGGGIDLQGKLPDHQYLRLDEGIKLYKENPESIMILCGKYSFLYEDEKPPKTEADAMRDYLISKKISEENIMLEEKSMDTIGNIYYLKKEFLPDENFKKLTVITSRFHFERVKYIFSKIFKREDIDFVAVKDIESGKKEVDILQRQKELIEKTKKYIGQMKNGDISYLDKSIYNSWYYNEDRPGWVKEFVAKGK